MLTIIFNASRITRAAGRARTAAQDPLQRISTASAAKRAARLARARGASDLSERLVFAATAERDEVLARLGTSEQGIAEEEAARRIERDGANVVAERRRAPAPLRFLASFASPFTLILAVLAVISLYTNVIAAAPGEQDPSTCVIILVMVGISGVLRFTQEDRGVGAAEGLRALVTNTCCVRRAGAPDREVPFSQVAVGDIVRLGAGDMVPADARVIEAKDLFVNQAALTGESEPQEKDADPGRPSEARALGVADCTDLVFSGTSVVSGTALAAVVATGAETYLGRVSAAAGARHEPTSFDRGLASVSRVLVAFMLVMCPVVFALNVLTKGDWLSALLFAVSVAVGITPQMLPVITTTCLARGARALADRKVIAKNLNAVQNLGAMDVLCCDKTGTLTEDQVVLERHLNVAGETDDRVLRHAFLVSYFQTGLRNLIDRAIIAKADELAAGSPALAGIARRYRKVDEVPFDFERRRMSVVVADGTGKTQMVTKGAVEEVLAACESVELNGAVRPLGPELRRRVTDQVAALNAEGMRVIAVAQKTNPRPVGAFGVADERGMVLIGYLAFLDPPKASARAAVEKLAARGVAVKVLTGDNEGVARTVCRKVGVPVEGMLTGADIEAMDDDELARAAEGAQLFAKLSPLEKARVVRALRRGAPGAAPAVAAGEKGADAETARATADEKRTGAVSARTAGEKGAAAAPACAPAGGSVRGRGLAARVRDLITRGTVAGGGVPRTGHVVGFMGDGINDAAAMRAADVGISVDTAVDVAKESADIVLARKDLGVVAEGAEEGRRTYGNTVKYLKVTASSNFGNVLSVTVASAALPFLPMTALQLLLLGLVCTVSCAALPWDRVDEAFLRRPHPWDARSIVSFMLEIGPTSSVFDLLTFAVLFFVVAPAAVGAPWAALSAFAAAGHGASTAAVAGPAARDAFAALFHTGWFVESLWTQALVLHALRTEQVPFLQSRPTPALTVVTLACTLAGTALPYAGPVAEALGLVPLPPAYYALLTACVVGYLALVSWAKRRYVRRHGSLF